MTKQEKEAVDWWNSLPISTWKKISGYQIAENAANWFAYQTPLEKIFIHRNYAETMSQQTNDTRD